MEMKYIKGITFAPFAGRGCLANEDAYRSLDRLIERTGADFIMLVPNGIQETAQSETIDYQTKATMSDEELTKTVNYIHGKGLRAALKPTANCKNGTWRAHISFLMQMCPVSLSGETGLQAIRISSCIMPGSHSRPAEAIVKEFYQSRA